MDFRATQRTAAAGENDLAVMLTGGGARAAYQVGLLRGIARHFPNLRIQIVTGVSAGAINAVFLASRRGSLAQKVEDLTNMWCELQCSSIWHFDWTKLIPFRSALSSVFWKHHWSRPGGFVDTKPLSELLHRVFDASPREPIGGIIENLHDDDIKAVSIIRLVEIGEKDVEERLPEIRDFLGENEPQAAAM